MTGLAIGVVSVAVLATAGALDSAGEAATIALPNPTAATGGPRRRARRMLQRAAASTASSATGSSAETQATALTARSDRAASSITNPDPTGTGCCSWHAGICGFMGSSVLCCDGETSPTCVAPLTPTTRMLKRSSRRWGEH